MATQNQTLGSGKLLFDRWYTDGSPRGERYLGNTTEFTISITAETKEHYDRDNGIPQKDQTVVTKTDRKASFTTDDISDANVALALFGTNRVLSTAAATGVDFVIDKVGKGLFYQIGATDSNPTGVRNLTSATVKKGATTLVLGTDYAIDLAMGRLEILTGTSTLSTGDSVTVTYSHAAQTRTQVLSGSEPIEGSLRFISTNAVGKQRDWYFPYVKLSPNGDYALKGEDWQQIKYDVEVLVSGSLSAIYVDGRPA